MKFLLSVGLIILAGMLLLRGNVSFSGLLGGEETPLIRTEASSETDLLPKTMLSEVNELRAQGCRCPDGVYYKPVPALAWNRDLETAAVAHSREMATKNYFSHIGKDGSNFTDRVTRAGYNWQTVAENIAYGYSDGRDVVKAWARSNGHCQNLMNPNFNEMGAAKQSRYWVQELGARPRTRTTSKIE